MLILGDIACPTEELNEKLASVFINNKIFDNKSIVCNLEGLVAVKELKNISKPILFNHPSVIETLSKSGVKVASLSNNHTLDLPESFSYTIDLLSKHNIHSVGAGRSKQEANNIVTFDDSGQKINVISACWDFLLYHQRNPEGGLYINTIDELKILDEVTQIKDNDPRAKILVFLHWSFDLEILPFPMYRQWAKALIDKGADFVVGCHSHCVQGGEKYKNGYIVYGLGNFFLPNGVFAGGKLKFPDLSKVELVFEFDFKTEQAWCHWFKAMDDHSLSYTGSELFEESETLRSYSTYQNMNEKEYLDIFKKKRRKKLLVPIYIDYQNQKINKFYTFLLKVRAKVARFLAERNIIGWQK